jgi:GNAT superfamily N-acetyltransferase
MAATLSRLAFRAKAYWGYPREWLEAWRDELTISPDHVAAHDVFVAVTTGRLAGAKAGADGGRISGFYALVCDAPDAELEHLWIEPDDIGSGVGRLLFEHSLARARSRRCHRVRIVSDPNAEAFYRHMGAAWIGVHHTSVLGHPRELPVLEVILGG